MNQDPMWKITTIEYVPNWEYKSKIISVEQFDVTMTELGKMGWEAYSVIQRASGFNMEFFVFFKRTLIEKGE